METSAEIWSPDHLQAYLSEHNIPANIMILEAETPTVSAAAEALNVNVEQIGKTVIFFIDGTPYAVIGNGVRRIDQKKLALRFGVNRKKIKLADGDAVIRLTGYAPGTVPPIGHREALSILVDPAVCQQDIIFMGGGGISAMLRIKSDDLLRVTNAEVLDVLE